MKTIFFLIITIYISSAFGAFLKQNNSLDTCSNFVLDGSIFKAKCSKSDGSKNDAQIDLNTIFGVNEQGFVVREPNGNYDGKCEMKRLEKTNNLFAKCNYVKYNLNYKRFNHVVLKNFIENDNGDLKAKN